MKILLFTALAALCLIAFSYLTRSAPTTRARRPQPDAMDVAQARAVLGLEEDGLDKDTVVTAHKRLMQHIHPDKGGSALLAQQLNEAKNVLLTHLKR